MKRFLTVALFVGLFQISHAQANNGQYAESGSLKVTFLSQSGGFTKLSILNKQTCEDTVEVHWDNIPTHVLNAVIAGSTSQTVLIGATGALDIKAKPLTNCNQQADMGWVELPITLTMLPIKLESIHTKYIGNGKIQVDFDVYDVQPGTTYQIQISTGVGVFKTVLFFDADRFATHYSKTIQINGGTQ